MLKKTAIPSQFPNCPFYLSKVIPSERSDSVQAEKRFKRAEQNLEAKNNAFLTHQVFSSFSELKSRIEEIILPSGITPIISEDVIQFVALRFNSEKVPFIVFSLSIDQDLKCNMSVNGSKFPSDAVTRSLGVKNETVTDLTAIGNVLAHLKHKAECITFDEDLVTHHLDQLEAIFSASEDENFITKMYFLIEQCRMSLKRKRSRRFSSQLMALAVIWQKISPQLYRHMLHEDLLCLPSERHIKRISTALTVSSGLNESTLTYLSLRIKNLSARERHIHLMIDEIYLSQRVEFDGGKIFGQHDDKVSKTMLSIMIKSLGGNYSDTVSLSPIDKLDSKLLKEILMNVLKHLTQIGFDSNSISVDNATVNRKLFVQELCGGNLTKYIKNPFKEDSRIYLLFDATHLFKNIRNNFQNKRVFDCPPFGNIIIGTPKYEHIEDLYNMECSKSVRLAHKLTDKSIHPNSLEKTSVQLANNIFHESTYCALEYYAKNDENKKDWQQTAEFLKIIRQMWNICNVKTKFLGLKLRDDSRMPITNEKDKNLIFLTNFSQWIKDWKTHSKHQSLTNETTLALVQTTSSMPELSRYVLKHCGFDYFLTGQAQSDDIEKRFGLYRKLSGTNFFISERQLLEGEKKVRLLNLLKFTKLSVSEIKTEFSTFEAGKSMKEMAETLILLDLLDKCPSQSCSIDSGDANATFYIAGYLSRKISKKLQCVGCKNMCMQGGTIEINFDESEILNEKEKMAKEQFLELMDRGGLIKPSDIVYMSCLNIRACFEKIMEHGESRKFLLECDNPRMVFCNAVTEMMEEKADLESILKATCENGCDFSKLLLKFAFCLFNILEVNYVKTTNDFVHMRGKRNYNNDTNTRAEMARKVAKLTSTQTH